MNNALTTNDFDVTRTARRRFAAGAVLFGLTLLGFGMLTLAYLAEIY